MSQSAQSFHLKSCGYFRHQMPTATAALQGEATLSRTEHFSCWLWGTGRACASWPALLTCLRLLRETRDKKSLPRWHLLNLWATSTLQKAVHFNLHFESSIFCPGIFSDLKVAVSRYYSIWFSFWRVGRQTIYVTPLIFCWGCVLLWRWCCHGKCHHWLSPHLQFCEERVTPSRWFLWEKSGVKEEWGSVFYLIPI